MQTYSLWRNAPLHPALITYYHKHTFRYMLDKRCLHCIQSLSLSIERTGYMALNVCHIQRKVMTSTMAQYLSPIGGVSYFRMTFAQYNILICSQLISIMNKKDGRLINNYLYQNSIIMELQQNFSFTIRHCKINIVSSTGIQAQHKRSNIVYRNIIALLASDSLELIKHMIDTYPVGYKRRIF